MRCTRLGAACTGAATAGTAAAGARVRAARAGPGFCWMVCVSSCAIRRWPAALEGWYSPAPKNTWSPTVNARAPSARAAPAAASPVCTRTSEKSNPKRGSSLLRSAPGKGAPPPALMRSMWSSTLGGATDGLASSLRQ